MILNAEFINEEKLSRFGWSLCLAVFVHIAILCYFSYTSPQKTISSELLSLPTNVTIRFSPLQKPVKKVTKEVHKTVPKQIAKAPLSPPTPEVLNTIEPAAAVQQVQRVVPKQVEPKDAPESIPVVNERHLKGRRVSPQYPERALRMRQEGVVWLRVLISETGSRQDIKIHRPTKYALLNQAALKAVKKWTFTPNVVNGKSTKSWVDIPIEFKIQ